ncbi:hypothetical protein D9M68_283810 [compost metagenome]
MICALYLPKTVSNASLISPNVALFLAASTASSNKLPLPDLAASVNLCNVSFTFSVFLVAFILSNCSNCCLRTIWLSTSKICNGSSFSKRYLFTPTIMSWLESIRACFLAAASSILNLGIPASMALVIPPNSSTS